MIIGITGKSGSGKNYFVEQHLMKFTPNIIHIDIDKIGHDVLKLPILKDELYKTFGDSIFIERNCKYGDIDTKKVGDLIFNDRKKYKEFADVGWKHIENYVDDAIQKFSTKYIIVINWILLPATKYFNMCDIKYLMVRLDKDRKESVIKRDDISEEYFDLRDKNSPEYVLSNYDYIITH